MANKILKSGSNYFQYGNTSLVTVDTDATVISSTETPDIIPAWLAYAGTQFPSQDFEAVDQPEAEAYPNGLPSIKTLPPHP
jgi:hypothetical protein